jgi:hypothetical protein
MRDAIGSFEMMDNPPERDWVLMRDNYLSRHPMKPTEAKE